LADPEGQGTVMVN